MKRFLVTGSKGQVGHYVVQKLTGKAELLAVSHDELDITDESAVKKIVENFRPNAIINAAAYTSVDSAEKDIARCEAVNTKGAGMLANAAQQIDALILHISTDYIFNGKHNDYYKETDQPDPQNVYGRTKLAGETAVRQANPKSIILRTAWVFGEHGNNFVKTMLRLGKERAELGIVADQIGGPTYAGDIAAALIKIAFDILNGKTDAFGIYHFSGQPYVSWFEFARTIFAEAKMQNILENIPHLNAIATSDYPTPAKRPANSRLDLTKIQQTWGIEPSDWKKALQNLKAYAE
ncbi:dTDP-4-dehydrorhamnose reductase [Necropsobacter rosorum]|uniref:dTDP-4-dehydrorhamnose reductase n=1 Tax=Necropsobacter rosorum TaxID=908285 RepID=UPI000509EFFC